jgi:soluble lytic murein transglycosylase
MIKTQLSIRGLALLSASAAMLLLGSAVTSLPPTAAATLGPALSQMPRSGTKTSFLDTQLRQQVVFSPVARRFQQILRQNTDPAHLTAAALAVLGDDEAQRYRHIFDLLDRGEAGAALMAANELRDGLLLGHVRAAAYLDRGSRADFMVLRDWLKHYADHPQAAEIFALAQRRRPRGDRTELQTPLAAAPLTGSLGQNTSRQLLAQVELSGLSADEATQAANFNGLLRNGQVEAAQELLNTSAEANYQPQSWAMAGRAAIAAARFFSEEADALREVTDTMTKDTPLAAWIAGLQAWRNQDFGLAATMFGRMTDQEDRLAPADRAAAFYWRARAQEKIGSRSGANAALKQAAQCGRCFYGQLARAKLGAADDFVWDLPALTPDGIAKITATPAGRRGLALLQIGQRERAESEFLRLPLRGQTQRAYALLALAQQQSMPTLTLRLGSFLRNDNGRPFDAALYPVADWQGTQGAGIDRALVHAVIRQESRFDAAATSHAGARGVMQVMPATARYLETGIETKHLADPERNVNLGSRYLGYLAEQKDIGRNLMMMLAAYNAGPGNLQRWRTAIEHNDDPLLFIETLPVRETRHYVQYVLGNYWAYQSRFGMVPSGLKQLTQGQWPILPPASTTTVPRPTTAALQTERDQTIKLASR